MYSFKNDTWIKLSDLHSNCKVRQSVRQSVRQLIVMDGMLFSGNRERLHSLDLSATELIYELVHFAVGLDFMHSHSKPNPWAMMAERAKKEIEPIIFKCKKAWA